MDALVDGPLPGIDLQVVDGASATESDFAELQARVRDDRARIDALEDSVKRLEALLERERDRARVETSR